MTTRCLLFAALALGFASTAFQPLAQEAGPLSEDDVAAITSQTERFRQAILAGDWAANAGLFTQDGVLMPPNHPAVQGRTAIQEWGTATFGAASFTEFTNAPVEIDGRGGIAYSRATYSLALSVEGIAEPITDTGKYIVIWKKQADGAWLAVANPWNSDLPLPEPQSE